jgi:hypothetical protein
MLDFWVKVARNEPIEATSYLSGRAHACISEQLTARQTIDYFTLVTAGQNRNIFGDVTRII